MSLEVPQTFAEWARLWRPGRNGFTGAAEVLQLVLRIETLA
jgi:hypothetical protein